MMPLHDTAAAIRAKIAQRNGCGRVSVFVQILTGTIAWADADAPLAAWYSASPLHVMAGTYDAGASEPRILADLMQTIADATARLQERPMIIHTRAGEVRA